MRFASLGSGSKGNATLIEAGQTLVMVDCGFSTKELEKRMQRLEVEPTALDAILVTHEHSDHVQGVGRFSRKYQIPVWMTPGTHVRCRRRDEYPHLELFNSHDAFGIGDIQVHPFPVPHDAQEPVQFVFHEGDLRLGLLTDTGTITPHIIDMLSGLDALILEGNHDLDMLLNGPYPDALKKRVSGRLGHLSNEQAAGLLGQIDHSRLQLVAVAHLSEKNNHPDKAMNAFSDALGEAFADLVLADQQAGLDWHVIQSGIQAQGVNA